GVHVALDDLALGALELLEQHAGFELNFFDFAADGAGLPAIFFLLFLAASGVGLALEVRRLTIERAHAVDRLVETLDEALALGIGESELADGDRGSDDRAGQPAAGTAMIARIFLLRNF